MTKSIKYIDLKGMTCPLLFVTFKWHIAHSEGGYKKLRFQLSPEQDISDIMRYLDTHKYEYLDNISDAPYIEVFTIHA